MGSEKQICPTAKLNLLDLTIHYLIAQSNQTK